MRCVLAFLTFSSLLSALVDAYGLDEMQISKLPQETVSALSKLSPGPVSHSMTFQESLDATEQAVQSAFAWECSNKFTGPYT